MSCFKLPLGLCKKINSLLSNFWWKNHETGKGIYWKSWKKLGIPKREGGLGFKDIEGFNLALLGKQIWRLATQPDSLLAKVLKSKYFPRCSPLKASLGSKPSFGWRSIHASQLLMRQGMQKQFGDGNNLEILSDPWLPTLPPRPPRPNPLFDPQSYCVSHFKDPGSDQWNLFMIRQGFVEDDVGLICQIKPGHSDNKASYSWNYNHNGEYSVKSGYWVWRNRLIAGDQANAVINPSLTPLYTGIWSLKAPPKIKHFLWRSITNCLAVGVNMSKKRLTKLRNCPRCPDSDESINHLLFQCPYARLLWSLSPASHLLFPSADDSLYENFSKLLFPVGPKDQATTERNQVWPWLLWRIWLSRNDLTFSAKDAFAGKVIDSVLQDCKEWMTANNNGASGTLDTAIPIGRCSTGRAGHTTWKAPPLGWLKCNVDGSWNKETENCGVAWLLRDHHGIIKQLGVKKFPFLLSPLEAEATALSWATRCVKNLGYNHVVFESDCANIVKAVQDPGTWPRLRNFTDDISIAREGNDFKFSHIMRSANACADALAKSIYSYPLYYAFLDVLPPVWLRPLMENDMNCNALIVRTF